MWVLGARSESRREPERRTSALGSDGRAGLANEAGRLDREPDYCTCKLSESRTAAGPRGWLSTPRARDPGAASSLAWAAAGSMVCGGGGRGTDPGGRAAAAAPGAQRWRRRRRQRRRPGERWTAGAVGTAAMAKGRRRDPEQLLPFASRSGSSVGLGCREHPRGVEGGREGGREGKTGRGRGWGYDCGGRGELGGGEGNCWSHNPGRPQ